MKEEMLTIGLILGSVRKNRQSIKPAGIVADMLREKGVEIVLLDLQQLDLPVFDDDIMHPGKMRLLKAYTQVDGIVLVSPEYNYSLPSSVKNAIDYARNGELKEKPLAVVSASDGSFGGVRMIEHLRSVMAGVGAIVVPPRLMVPDVDKFNPDQLTDEFRNRAEKFVEQTVRWFKIIKIGKQQV